MNLQDRIKMQIGELVFANLALDAELREVKAQLATLRAGAEGKPSAPVESPPRSDQR